MTRINLALIALSMLLASVGAAFGATERIGDYELDAAPDQIASQLPFVSMPSGVLSTSDGRELWSRDVDTERAMASTTKIMTAVVVLENASLDETLAVTSSAGRVGESVAGLNTGDVFTVRTVLEGMLVKSGNDAAEALAVYVGGSEAGFVAMMNKKAAELGLSATQFANPHGLDAIGHHTTARDLAILARYSMSNDEFRRIVGLASVDLDGQGPAPDLQTSNLLIGDYLGTTGIKTGWTNDAGYCLVASAKRRDIELFVVVLGTKTEDARFDQAKALLDWGFEHYASRYIASKDETLGAVPVTDYLDVFVPAVVALPVKSPVFDLDGDVVRKVDLYAGLEAPVSIGQKVGTLSLLQGERLLAQVPLVAGAAVERPGIFERIWIGVVRGWRTILGN
ncbi:MAG: D-alanyl-D-alanine carboxypeptidase family protein [Coriobacteriia bacterium]|nr:D-alanyl-D-alanine carboxypeptidase family protein [Coriobacteriia bacterium]